MIKVTIKPGESVEKALRRFKRLCMNEGVYNDMKRGAYYEKPSVKRRRRERKRLRNIQQQGMEKERETII